MRSEDPAMGVMAVTRWEPTSIAVSKLHFSPRSVMLRVTKAFRSWLSLRMKPRPFRFWVS